MVDVSPKPVTPRTAVASGRVLMSAATLEMVRKGDTEKGDVRAVAELAGIMAAKRTSELIPLCHMIALDQIRVEVGFTDDPPSAWIRATTKTSAKTGVEMEALTAVAVTALTIYDMIKAVDRHAVISEIRLVEKRGGQSGDVRFDE